MPTETSLKAEEALVHVLWINAGLSCDGDSVALTAATQPSVEEIALGALPGLPRIAVHWPLIDFECGQDGADDFLEWFPRPTAANWSRSCWWSRAPSRTRSSRAGYWCGFGNDPRPASRSPPASGSTGWRPRPRRSSRSGPVRHVRRHPRHGRQSHRRDGVADYLGWDWKSKAGIPIVCVPGCPVQPDNLVGDAALSALQAAGQRR